MKASWHSAAWGKFKICITICFVPDTAQNALQQEWANFPFANWNGISWGLLLQLAQLIKIHFLPHLESFMWEQKFEKKFFKRNYIQTPNGVLLIFKLPFPNGNYCNGVCRALWARTPQERSILTLDKVAWFKRGTFGYIVTAP